MYDMPTQNVTFYQVW